LFANFKSLGSVPVLPPTMIAACPRSTTSHVQRADFVVSALNSG